ncbi:MAG TPA: dihydrodipicolinate synthase family protein [Gemmatimonadaceae bacterium]|jgi:4-hydroxy-2-oxoglutarate aldolase
MTKKLEGVFAPVITTFYPEGELDVASFAANVRAHLHAGLHGIVVAGSTGEAALLDFDERAALVDATRELTPADKWVIVGTGAESTRTCLKQTKEAAKRGADAALVVAPHYYANAMTEEALRQHYRRVADESPVPVILYSIPKYMHFSLPETLVAELAQHENVIGIKDSSGNKDLLTGFLKAKSSTFSVLVGNAQMFHHALMNGATGGILAAAMFAPQIALDIFDNHSRGDMAAAEAAQLKLTPLGAKIVGELGVPGVKAALDRVGLSGGPMRLPLQPLDEKQAAAVDELLPGELVPA